jgi:hypothetical protein
MPIFSLNITNFDAKLLGINRFYFYSHQEKSNFCNFFIPQDTLKRPFLVVVADFGVNFWGPNCRNMTPP